MKILLPVCAQEDAKLIVDFVSNYHWPAQANFNVVHVLGRCDTEAQLVEVEAKAMIFLTAVSERLKAVLPASLAIHEVLSGDPVYEIISAANRWKADMIVMGSRTREDIESFLAGSVAKGVLMQAACSVVVIKPPHTPTDAAELEAVSASCRA